MNTSRTIRILVTAIIFAFGFTTFAKSDEFTVKFFDYDSVSILSAQQVEEGKDAILPDNPTRIGYKFIGWDGFYTNITQDTSLYAKYEIEHYTVQFLDFDSTLISKKDIDFGDEITPPTVDEKECYPFKSWNSDFSNVISDTAFLALRDTNRYTVIFYDYDRTTVFDEQLVDCGTTAIAPEDPTRFGYVFAGWDGSFADIKQNTVVYATYTPEQYKVQFLDFDSTLIQEQTIAFGAAVTPPTPPTKECNPFKVWNSDFSNIISDTAFLALRDTNRYTVIFYDYDGVKVLKEEQIVDCGCAAITPEKPTRTGYTFTGWNCTVTNVRTNLVVKAQYIINKYHVTLSCENGTAFGAGDYNYNKEVTIIAKPSEHSTFVRWSDGDENATRKIIVVCDTNITAICELDKFQVDVTAEHGTAYGTKECNYGEQHTIFAEAEEGYQFSHWSDGDTTNVRTFMVVQALNLKAIFTPKPCKVVYNSPYASVVSYHYENEEYVLMDSTSKFYYGEKYRFEAVARIGYYFARWDEFTETNPVEFVVVKDTVLNPICEPFSYTITTHDTERGLVTGGNSYYFGDVATITAYPNEHYQFLKWDDEYAANPRLIYVSQDMDITPIFVLETHTITASVTYGTLTGDGAYDYNSEATLEVLPLAHCHFERWTDGNTDNPRKVTVVSDTAFSAICAYDKHSLSLDFDAEKGNVEGAGIYDYGTQVAVTATAKDGYYFSHWSDGRQVNPLYITVLSDTLIHAVFNKTIVIDDQEFKDSVAVVATDTMAIFMWQSNPNALTYSLMYWYGNATGIKLLTLDKYGNIQGTSSEDQPEVSVIYYSLTGLKSNTLYEYVWQSKAANGTTIKQINGTFQTAPSSTAVKNVSDDLPHVYARNGRIYGDENMRIYTTTGLDVTSQNGHLTGVYVVVVDTKAIKVVVY